MNAPPGFLQPARWLTPAFVFLSAFALFRPSLQFDFVYDARYQILSGAFLHDPTNWGSVLSLRVMSMDVLDFHRPAHLASLMLDSAVWGLEPFGYHLTNVVLHAVNAVLVYFLGLRIISSLPSPRPHVWPAVAGALLFAVHPLQAEAACEPTYREDLLVVFFTLAALLCASGVSADSIKSRRVLRGAACAVLCFLACASKETGFAAAGILLLWRLCFGDGGERKWWSATLVACFASTAVFAVLRFTLETPNSIVFETKPDFLNGSLPAALATQPIILALYARNFFLPVGLCADYGPASLATLSALEAWAGLCVILALAALAALRSRPVKFALGFIAVALLPVSNLLPMYHPAADRYLYLPLAGAGFLLAAALSALPPKGWPFRITSLGILVFLGTMALVAWNRQMVWRDSHSLWADTAKKNPISRNAWLGLGFDLQRRGLPADSMPYFLRALEISGPDDAEAWMGLAVAMDARCETTAAREAVARALAANPDFRHPRDRMRRALMERQHAADVGILLEKLSGSTVN